MKMWASRQMRQELMTGRAGLIIGGTLTFLVFLVLILVNQMQGEMRVHPVSTADEAAEAQEAGWIAETAYSRKELLGSVTLETASQGEISFMMGGVIGAAPGRKVTTEEEYRIWALEAEGFTAILFTNRDEVPSGSVRMDSVIKWLTESDRKGLEEEFSDEGRPAFVFLLEKEQSRWFEAVCGAIVLMGTAAAAWLLFTKKGLMTTKIWKSMNAAGNAEEIWNDLDDPQYARMGFAVARKYICVNGRVIPRRDMRCTLQTDENGDQKIVFERAGRSTEYYPDEDELNVLSGLLKFE